MAQVGGPAPAPPTSPPPSGGHATSLTSFDQSRDAGQVDAAAGLGLLVSTVCQVPQPPSLTWTLRVPLPY